LYNLEIGGHVRNLLKLEEAAMFALAVLVFKALGLPWWWFALLLLAPDLGALGYLAGPQVGAITYNLVHHKGVAIVLYLLGVWMNSVLLQLAGIVLFAHSSADRVFGFGLKYPDSFNNTHLGPIGQAASGR
jgi:hypothetical protein